MAIGLLFLLVPLSGTFQHGGGPMEEGILLVYPELVQQGAVPYRDFETFYGPANPYLLAAVYTIFGTNIGVERAVGFLFRALIFVALYCLTRRWGTLIASGSMLLAGILLLPLGSSRLRVAGRDGLWALVPRPVSRRPKLWFIPPV